MFQRWFILSIFVSLSGVAMSSVEYHIAKEEVIADPKEMEDFYNITKSYSSLFENQDTGCYCKENFCECCEDKIGDKIVCLSIGYYEVLDIPAAFGINITVSRQPFASFIVNVTDLPCIHLPYIQKSFALCLQLHGFNKTQRYVRVLFDMKVKFPFSSLTINLGCLLIPRLHPDVSEDMVQYNTVLNKMGIHKPSTDRAGLAFCSSGSASRISTEYSTLNFFMASLLFINLLNILRS